MNAYLLISVLTVLVVLGTGGCGNNEPVAGQPTTKPDNTAINRTDPDTAAKTPTDQLENAADIKITAEIRRSVLDDKGLSTNAHNAKIVTANGAVTLRGVVDTANERDVIETKAKAVAGVTSVDNQLTIKNP